MAYSKKSYLSILETLRTLNGPRSLAGSIRPERLDAIAERMVSDGVELSEFAVHNWLTPFKAYHGPLNFLSGAEIEKNILIAQRKKNAPPKIPDDDATRDTLKSLSAVEKLDFANGLRKPQKPVVLSIDADDNFTKGNE